MRPRLDPAMGQWVLCARVAIQATKLFYQYDHYAGTTPAECAAAVARYLPLDGFGSLRFALHSLAVYLGLGWTSKIWLQSVLERLHFGSSFRAAFFFDYKVNRSPYPRVTNRGVQNSMSQLTSRKQGGKRIATP